MDHRNASILKLLEDQVVELIPSGVLIMVVRVFVFGRPGSGKTTASAYMKDIAQDKSDKWSTFRINDYMILKDWFHLDTEHKRFCPIKYNGQVIGFDIIIPKVYDEALQELKDKVLQYHPSKENELIVIEFARSDYEHALKLLGRGFMENAYFLFLDADIDTCTQRIHERVQHRITFDEYFIDDHFVSDSVINCYDRPNYVETNTSLLKTVFGIDDERIKIVDNSKTHMKDELYNEMLSFVKDIKRRHDVLPQGADIDIIIANEPDQIDTANSREAFVSLT